MYRALRGMNDALPHRAGGSSELRRFLEETSSKIFRRFGYNEIRTPILEEKDLFVKSIGDQTDIVTKEMFSFCDRGERDVAMRPEGTAPIVRAYLEASLHKTMPFQKFYYIEPMFRAERPQAGRLRQFNQIGAEAIGSLSPAIDAEAILLLTKILDECKINGYTIRLNNLGCHADKIRLSKNLKENLSDKKSLLCDDCKKRLSTNPLRVLDCKKENCRFTVRGVMKSIDFLCDDCKSHFSKVKELLGTVLSEKKCIDDPYIVRGLDYYTRTVFEISHPALGAQDAIGAGGRYDNLIKDMGGPALGAVGFALGVERMIMTYAKDCVNIGEKTSEFVKPVSIYIATIGEKAQYKAFKIMDELRNSNIGCDMDYEEKSLKAQMRAADKLGAKFVYIIGDEELEKGSAILRNMKNTEQHTVKFEEIKEKLKTYNL